MKALTCAATRRRLQAFHDRELDVRDQIAVGAHLEWCDQCAELLGDLRAIHVTLNTLAPRNVALSHEEAGAFNAAVLNRLNAEHDESFLVRARSLLEQPHLLYAGLGAAVATVVCVVVMLGMMRFATNERPDSLAGIVSMLATPLECEFGNELVEAAVCRERWVERFQRANEAAEQDAVFTLEAVLTTEQHLPNLTGAHRRGGRTAPGQVKLIEGLLDAVSRSRLDAGQPPQTAPAASSMTIWLLARETVRATKPVAPLDVPLPPKKRAASLTSALHITRA
jgi:Putative zinc-finger